MHVTTAFTLRDDLKRSLRERGVPIGSTWGSFCDAMETLGVRRDDLLASMEVGIAADGLRRIVKEQSKDGEGWEVREVVR